MANGLLGAMGAWAAQSQGTPATKGMLNAKGRNRHFILAAPPCSPTLLFLTASRDAKARDYGGIRGAYALLAVSGEPGVGKTLAVQAFARSLDPRSIVTVPLSAPPQSLRAFLRALVLALGEHPAWTTAELLAQIHAIVTPWREAGKLLLVTIDEAQDLPQEVLAGLRSLLATPLGEPLPLRILLVGTGSLPAHLRSQAMEPIAQRVSLRVRLYGFTRSESAEFLLGLGDFTPEAQELLFQRSRAIPRILAALARLSLRAAEQHQGAVSVDDVQGAVEEFDLR